MPNIITDEALFQVLLRPVTRTNAEVTLLAEYAAVAVQRIQKLKRELREAREDAREAAAGAATEARWQERQGAEYGSY